MWYATIVTARGTLPMIVGGRMVGSVDSLIPVTVTLVAVHHRPSFIDQTQHLVIHWVSMVVQDTISIRVNVVLVVVDEAVVVVDVVGEMVVVELVVMWSIHQPQPTVQVPQPSPKEDRRWLVKKRSDGRARGTSVILVFVVVIVCGIMTTKTSRTMVEIL